MWCVYKIWLPTINVLAFKFNNFYGIVIIKLHLQRRRLRVTFITFHSSNGTSHCISRNQLSTTDRNNYAKSICVVNWLYIALMAMSVKPVWLASNWLLHLHQLITRQINWRLTILQKANYGHIYLPVRNLLHPVQCLSRYLHNKAFNTIHTVRTAINFHISLEQYEIGMSITIALLQYNIITQQINMRTEPWLSDGECWLVHKTRQASTACWQQTQTRS